MPTRTPSDARKKRLAHIVEKYESDSKTMKFMGIPITDLSRKELLAVLCYTNLRLTNMMNRGVMGTAYWMEPETKNTKPNPKGK